MFKFIFDLATEPLGLPIEWYYEWIIRKRSIAGTS